MINLNIPPGGIGVKPVLRRDMAFAQELRVSCQAGQAQQPLRLESIETVPEMC